MKKSIIAIFALILINVASIGANAATYTVSKIADTNDGVCNSDCSLREAIATANSTIANDTINFSVGGFSTSQTINIGANGQLTIANNGSLIIIGTSSHLLSISGNNLSRIFSIDSGADVSISNLTVTGGRASASLDLNGGGIRNSGTLNLNNSSIVNNLAINTGGAILNNSGNLIVTNSTISGNSAEGGGGIYNNSNSTLTVSNSTVSGNTASTPNSQGGGLFNAGGVINLINTTITNNSIPGEDAGIHNAVGTVNSRNSIIAGNFAGSSPQPDYGGTLNSQGYNFIGSPSGTTAITGDTTGNILNQSARLAPLGFYGGQTMIHTLLSGSPAINAGNTETSPTHDQRGAARIGTADIGSFELNNTANGGIFVAALPNGSQNIGYNFTLVPNSGPFTFSVTSGALPNGLSLTTNFAPSTFVALTGTPTQSGTFNFAITAANGVNSNTTNYSLLVLAPTAASSTVNGRVFTQTGRGLANAVVVMTNQNGESVRARTNHFGYYRFTEVQSGETYIFSVQSKRYQFASQVVNVSENLESLNFTAQ